MENKFNQNDNPCGCPYEVVIVSHKCELYGVSATGKFTECTRCRMQWMTHRKECELDMAIKKELEKALESANAEIEELKKSYEDIYSKLTNLLNSGPFVTARNIEAENKELREALESAKGWVVSYGMQTYSKVAYKEAEKITELLAKYEKELG